MHAKRSCRTRMRARGLTRDERPTVTERGFTLVELLVVVAIIAVLISILLPALAGMRREANSSRCRANLRGIGTAAAVYGNANADALPPAKRGPGPGDVTGVLREEIASRWGQGIWVCPSHHGMGPTSGYTSSYGYNVQYMMTPGPSYPHTAMEGLLNAPRRRASVSHASEVILFIDHDVPEGNFQLWSYVARPGDTTNTQGYGHAALRHNDTANVGFVDGHADAVTDLVVDATREAELWDPR